MLEVPIFISIALFASSFTIVMAERAIERGNASCSRAGGSLTIALGAIFVLGTAREWYSLIYEHGLTISSSLFGTTFYSLVGLHLSHVIIGLTGLSIVMVFAAARQGEAGARRAHRRVRACIGISSMRSG